MKTLLLLAATALITRTAMPFDGRPWNVSTGNLSVNFIQASPIGALPRPDVLEPPPSDEVLARMKTQGLVAYEDYIAWGAIERESGKWDWTQHDRMCDAVHKAGLKYVVYNWTHFPPTWLRDSPNATLMRCVEHNQTTNYLSIFDPKTIALYDRFYRALAQHFGDRIDGVYACISGPYGEGNYPLSASDWVVNLSHCHEGYWCADPYALEAFRAAMQRKYQSIGALNAAWGTTLGAFAAVLPPREIKAGLKPSPALWKTAPDRRRWLDFITWYHQAMIDFAEQSIKVVLKYFPREKVRAKPGGNAGGVNPIAWGTYSPGYAKMAQPYGIVLQPADCQGAYFGDKWIGTAYQFYGVREATEPAGGLDKTAFVRRMFSDASCGAAQLFTYEFEQHAPEIQQYAPLVTGKPSDTEIAVYCPTTLYRLGGDIWPTIGAGMRLRDLTDYDVLDELLITDGALTNRYRRLLLLQSEWVEQPVLDRIEAWVRQGGTLIVASQAPIKNVEGRAWPALTLAASASSAVSHRVGRGAIVRTSAPTSDARWLKELRPQLSGARGFDGQLDGVWITQRGQEMLLLNTTGKAVRCKVQSQETEAEIEIAPHTIQQTK